MHKALTVCPYCGTGCKINLLVEDNKINQLVAEQNFKKFGLEVVCTENGKTAIEKVKTKTHHDDVLAILDDL